MARFKVRLFYSENKPDVQGKTFEVDYEIKADDSRSALKQAIREFMRYENYNSASWIRSLAESASIVIPALSGRFLDEWGPEDLLQRFCNAETEEQVLIIDGIRCVPRLRDHPAIQFRLSECLDHPDPAVRIATTETLRRSGREEVMEMFARRIREEKSPQVRASMIALLGEREARDFLPLIRQHITDPDDRVRANAVDSIQRLGSEEDIPRLLELQDDTSNRVQANVITAVWRLGRLYFPERLSEMLASDDERMRASAVFAIGEVQPPDAAERLTQAISDTHVLVRCNAARSLHRMGDSSSLQKLTSMLADPEDKVRQCVTRALLAAGDRAAEPLFTALRLPELRPGAREVLRELSRLQYSQGRLFDWLSTSLRRRLVR